MQPNLEKKIAAALARRRTLAPLQAYRLFDGAADGIANLIIDRYGAIGIIQDFGCQVDWLALGDQLAKWLHLPTLLWRDCRQGKAQSPVQLLTGELGANLQVREHGINYQISPMDQANAGLFLDMREVRLWLLNNAKNRRVLNAFCFTGSLGLAAWCGGAREVVQIDLSQRMLSWAKKNWQANRQHPHQRNGTMRFIKEDCRDFLTKARRRLERGEEGWDIVIMDPPTFGASKGRPFQLLRHLPALIDDAVALLAPKAQLLVTHNQRQLTQQKLKELLQASLTRAKPKMRQHDLKNLTTLLPPPLDFRQNHNTSNTMRGYRLAV